MVVDDVHLQVGFESERVRAVIADERLRPEALIRLPRFSLDTRRRQRCHLAGQAALDKDLLEEITSS